MDSNKRSVYLLLAGIILLAAFLRFYRIGDKSLWLDEVYSVANVMQSVDVSKLPKGTVLAPRSIFSEDRAVKSFREIWSGRSWEPHPPLYYIFLKVWVTMAGSSDRAFRSLSALFSVLVIIGGFLIARDLSHPQAGLITAALLATSPINIYYAQESRNYAVLLAFLLMSFYCLLRMQQTMARRYGLGYVLCVTAAIYMHYFACWILLAQAVYVALQKDRPFKLRWVCAVTLAGLLYLPWLPLFWAQYVSLADTQQDWLLVDRPLGLRLLDAAALPFKLIFSKDLFVLRTTTGVHFKFLLQLAGLAASLFLVWRRFPRSFLLLACWIFVPIGALLALDTVAGSDMLKFSRYSFVLSPAVYLLLALVLVSLDRRIAGVMLGVLLIVNLHIVQRYYQEAYKVSDWKGAALYIRPRLARGDLVIIYKPQKQSIMTPAWLMSLGRYFPFQEHPVLLAESESLSQETLAEVTHFGRIAVVAAGPAPLPVWLLDHYSVREEARFAHLGTVTLLTRAAPANNSRARGPARAGSTF